MDILGAEPDFNVYSGAGCADLFFGGLRSSSIVQVCKARAVLLPFIAILLLRAPPGPVAATRAFESQILQVIFHIVHKINFCRMIRKLFESAGGRE